MVRLHCAQTGEALTEVCAPQVECVLLFSQKMIQTSHPLYHKHRVRCTLGGSTSRSMSKASAGTPSTSTASPFWSTTGEHFGGLTVALCMSRLKGLSALGCTPPPPHT